MTNINRKVPSALARPAPVVATPWKNQDWQQLWLASQADSRPWRTLALVPAGPGATPETMLQIAVALAHTGMTHLGMPIHVADGTRVTLSQLVQFSEELKHYSGRAGMVLVALSPLSDNVTSLNIAQDADRALLCVLLRKMSTSAAKQTIERVGAAHFIGSAVFRMP